MYAAVRKAGGDGGVGCDDDPHDGGKNGTAALEELTEQGGEGSYLCSVCPSGSQSVWFLDLTAAKPGQEQRLQQPRKVD